MDLKKAVERFGTETYADIYNLSSTFSGKISVFNEVTNSGESARRRVLETLPSVSIPSNRVIIRNGETFIIGHGNHDEWRGEALRTKYPVLPILATSKVCSLNQILTNSLPSKLVYGSINFTKNLSLELQESEVGSNFSFFFPYTETVNKGNIIVHNSNAYYRVRNVPYVDAAGFLVADCVYLESPVQSLLFSTSGGYDPATDTIINPASSTIACFVEEAYLFYDKSSLRAEAVKPGDKSISCKPVITPNPGNTLGSYTVLSVDTDTDGVFNCHCRLT